MIVLNLLPPNTIAPEVHTGTIAYLYADEGLEILLDTFYLIGASLLGGTLDYEVTEGEEYFLTTRFVFTPGGMQQVSEPESLVGTNTKDSSEYIYIPRPHNPPLFFPSMGLLPPGFFRTPKIELGDYNDTVKLVVWLISDFRGMVYFFKETTDGLEGVIVDNMLHPDKTYLIRASLTFMSGDTTELNFGLFTAGGFVKDGLKILKVEGCPEAHPILTTSIVNDFKHNLVKITVDGEVIDEFLTSEVVDIFSRNIDKDNFIVEITAELNSGKLIGPIFHYVYINEVPRLPLCLPFKLPDRDNEGLPYKLPLRFPNATADDYLGRLPLDLDGETDSDLPSDLPIEL